MDSLRILKMDQNLLLEKDKKSAYMLMLRGVILIPGKSD